MRHGIAGVVVAIICCVCCGGVLRAALPYTGVNLSGAEFAPQTIPGTYNTTYTYPTNAEVDYYLARGMNTFRLPFLWERLQPGATDASNVAFNAAELGRIQSFVSYATARGATVILDPHNYGRYSPNGTGHSDSTTIIGVSVPVGAFTNFWSQLAGNFKSNSRVMFGLMNEPNTMDTDLWVSVANAAIAAIRNTGATNQILVPGNRWTGGWSWNSSNDGSGASNATAMLNIVDSGHNYAIDIHQYLDTNASGTTTGIGGPVTPGGANAPIPANIGADRLKIVTQWLKTHNRRGFLSEFAVANSRIGTGGTQIGDEAIAAMLGYMEANSDVWQGWAWWGGGPWWGNYMFALDPSSGVDRPAMGALRPFMQVPVLYWDANGATTGAGTTPTGTWGSSTFWSADATGASSTVSYTSGSDAVFAAGTDATGSYTVTVTGTQTASSITVARGNVKLAGGNITLVGSGGNISINAGATTITSGISGNVGLTKLGAGVLMLTGTNAYTGNTTVSSGTLRLGVASDRLPQATALVVSAGATFDLNNLNQTVSSLSGDGVVSLGTGTLSLVGGSATTFGGTINGTGGLSVAGTGSLNLTGRLSIDAAATLTKTGAGTLSLSGTQTHGLNATLRVEGGSVRFNTNSGKPPASPATANLFVHLLNGTVNLNVDQHLRALDVDDSAVNSFVNIVNGVLVTVYGNGAGDGLPPGRDTIEGLWLDIASAATGGSGIRMAPGAIVNPSVTALSMLMYEDAHGETAIGLLENIRGDLNADFTVDLGDLSVMLGYYNRNPSDFGFNFFTNLEGDLNYDGAVDLGDLSVLLGNFGQSFDPFGLAALLEAEPEIAAELQGLDLALQPEDFSAAVPEPGTMGLLMLAAGAALHRAASRRRRNAHR